MSQYFRYPPAGAVTLSNYALETGGNLEDIKNILDAGTVTVTGDVNVISSVLPTGAATEATLSALNLKSAAGLVPEKFDEQVITYVGLTTDVSTVTYKLAGTTVATVTMSYDGSNRLTGVVKT